MKSMRFATLAAALAFTSAGWSLPGQAADIPVKTGETIAFLGDSITAQGASTPAGYVRLVISGLEACDVKATAIPAGISGHKSNNMLERLERDVLSKKPQWMTLSCGVNDVWHGANGVPLEDYKKNITAIVDKAQAANVKVMILTSTMIKENPEDANNKTAVAYNEFLKTLATEKKCLLADLNADMRAALAAAPGDPAKRGNVLTADGVHMNPAGNQMMATGILRAFGVTDEQFKKIKDVWLDIPAACPLNGRTALSLRQLAKLEEVAAKQKTSVPALLDAELAKAVDALLKTPAN